MGDVSGSPKALAYVWHGAALSPMLALEKDMGKFFHFSAPTSIFLIQVIVKYFKESLPSPSK